MGKIESKFVNVTDVRAQLTSNTANYRKISSLSWKYANLQLRQNVALLRLFLQRQCLYLTKFLFQHDNCVEHVSHCFTVKLLKHEIIWVQGFYKTNG